jgi:hypothetical protein
LEQFLIILAILGLGGGVAYLISRRGSKVDYNTETYSREIIMTPEEEAQVLETTFEVLEVEHEQDEEFKDNVTKLKDEVDLMSDTDVADYINSFLQLGNDPTDDKLDLHGDGGVSTDT